ncbi:hypothetical protein [Plebeiibacterium sediminum]|nr:hypothetical protein [Plebeiobacterium sediminum]
MIEKQYLIMGVVSGLMVCASYSLYYLSFISLVPLLYCFNNKEKINNYKILLATILFLILWNAFNYQFLYSFYIEDVKVYIPVLIGVFTVLELLPFIVLLSNLKFKRVYFICLWILMEYFISQWILKTPFSYLGILLANNASIIHWYNHTGVLGGSLWVIVVNVLITYEIGVVMRKGFKSFRYLYIIVAVIFLPITISLIISDTPMPTNEARKVKIHSYSSVCKIEQIQDRIIESNNDIITKGVCYDVFPELVINLNNENPEDNKIIESIINNNLQYKKDSLITILGANLTTWGKQQVLAVLINDDVVKTRYKDVLVPLGEEIPKMLDGIKNLDVYKNYLSETYITPDNNESIFAWHADSIHVSICYESFFEQNLKEKLKDEVGALFVIAREPFLNNYHYKNLTRLLSVCNAIIFNKYLVRSSWCGLSCIIDNRGYVLNEVYNKNDVLESVFYLNKKDTYYLTSRCNPVLVFILLLLFFVIMVNFTSRFII